MSMEESMLALRPTYSSAEGGATMRCTAEGEAWRLAWSFSKDDALPLRGVGIIMGQTLFAARSGNNLEQAFPSPGVVVYERDAKGELPARWYHPELQGRLGEGRSLGGPLRGYVGTYHAEYASTDGAFDPLIKEITQQGMAYRFSWSTKQEKIYIGIGKEFGPNLAAAWSTPRGSLEVAIYEIDPKLGTLTGGSIQHSDLSGCEVIERWQATP